jgi:hypothetical protein
MLLLLLSAACSSEVKKTPPPEALTAEKAFTLAEEIKDAFVSKNSLTLKGLCTESLYGELSPLITKFRDLKLDFTMRWVDIDTSGTVHLYVAWKRKAERQNEAISDSGMAVFVIKNDPFLADEILRENPFK